MSAGLRMRIAYLDCFSGISGDMFLGAAVDAGVSLDKLQAVARSLNVGAELRCKRVERGGIASTKVDVVVRGRVERPLDEEQEHTHSDHDHGHSHSLEHHEHEHSHGDHAHGHSHEHEHTHSHEHEHHVHRGLKEIRQIIGSAEIGTKAEKLALKAFELLAEAEGKIHNRHPESIHFHEVGSEDAIVDIVCSAVAAVELGVEEWYCSALNVGGGTVKCAHGVLPVPAPATAELLRGMPVYSSGVKKELLTPTGAALLGALDVRFEPLPAMSVSAAGYGAGGMDLPGTSNVVRLMVGESALRGGAALEGSDTVAVLEANIDDMNPQLFGYVQQKLLDAGALDAFGVPVQMKKGRPGIVMTALAKPADAELLSRILLTETTTLGVRMRREQRRVLDREHVKVESKWGAIRVKLGILQGEVVNCAPEFEDCRAIAEANGVPLKMVMQEAVRLYLSEAGEDESVGHAASGKASKSILS